MPRPKTHDEALRLRLLDRAGELLTEEGAKALSLRRLAADVDTSTTAVYSLFGSKPDLVNALYEEGFRRFGSGLRAVPNTDDAREDITRVALAYRDSALADRHLYSVLFTGVVPGFEPDERAARLAMHALEPLWDAVGDGIKAGVLASDVGDAADAGDVDLIAVSVWSTAHGLVSLELNAPLSRDINFCRTYERAIRANVDGWRAQR